MTQSSKLSSGKRYLYFDIMNIMSCLAVIALHHNSLVHSYQDTSAWRQSLIVEVMFYWAVPIFLMISGANLLDYRKKYSTKTFFQKRILRTVIPWFAWSVIFLIIKVHTGEIQLGDSPITEGLTLIATYKVESVYWFFRDLFACYLAIPVLSYLADKREALWYITGMNFLFLSCIPIMKRLFGFPWTLDVPITGSLLIFMLLGYLLNTTQLSRKQRGAIYLMGILGFLFRLIYTYIHSVESGSTDTTVKGYIMFHSVFLAAAVFVFLKHIPWEKLIPEKAVGMITKISSCSFGVYLLHKFVMSVEMDVLALKNTRFLWRICMIPVTYLITLLAVMLIKKIPVLKKLV